jgi:DnaK suppressor protein
MKNHLLAERKRLVQNALNTLVDRQEIAPNDFPDELDAASEEFIRGLALRLRDREGYYLKKVDDALRRIEMGTFGRCEECGEEIAFARLRARPVAMLCIRCKEGQEAVERAYGM